MKIGIMKETGDDARVSFLPDNIKKLSDSNISFLVESGAGEGVYYSDQHYQDAGAEVMSGEQLRKEADILVRINPFTVEEIKNCEDSNKVLISMFNPLSNHDIVKAGKEKGLTLLSLDTIPRITRAQTMDVLSSMATVAGYKAVLDAANHLDGFFPMFMTAAGTIKPANVLVLGAGVAGLQAIATARRLGAVVEVFDVRSAAKEDVQSLGGKFIEVEGAVESEKAGGYAVEQTEEFKKKQKQLVHDHALKARVIITTAQIPGKKAPVLVTRKTVDQMRPGSVIVDLAASSGGNCELTENNKTIKHKNITIIGNSNYPSLIGSDSSKMFGNNLFNYIKLIMNEEGDINLDFDDEIIKGSCVVHDGEIINERLKENN
jgi:NAD(P) transhydrogenase subunit alpha